MIRHTSLVAIAAVFAAWASAAHAEDNLKVGIIATLSGPPAVLGQQLRNGFQLAVKDLGGKLGGREAEIFVADDELKPDVAVTKVKSLIDRDKVDFVVGPIFSNILGAIAKPVTEAGVILISPNAGTSTFAGKECNPNLFVTSIRTIRCTKSSANTRRIPATRRSSSSCRTIRPAKTPPRASSTNSAARSPTKSMCRSASPIIRRSSRASPPRARTRSSPSFRAAWA
jgi:hypothetical protein